jgi:hypothetical protein
MITWIDRVISKLPPYIDDQYDSITSLQHLSIPLDVVTGIAILVSKYNKCDLYELVSSEYTKVYGGSVPDMAVHIAYTIAQRKILNSYSVDIHFKLDSRYSGYDSLPFNRMMLAGAILIDDKKLFETYKMKMINEHGYNDQNIFDTIKTVAVLNSCTKFADFLDYVNISV